MSIINFLRLLKRNWKVLLILPTLSAIVVFFVMHSSKKQYESSMKIYTGFGSGYNITSNNGQKYDYFAVTNEFDNLINTMQSDEVMESVGLKLFAQGMIYGAKGDKNYITEESYDQLLKIVPGDVKALVDTSSIDRTLEKLRDYMNRGTDNFVFKLINLYHPHYSIHALDNVEVRKIGSSDLLEVSYKCDDPAICYQTLNVIGKEFLDDYKTLKFSETSTVVSYFESRLSMSAERLRASEDSYMDFSKKNRVINYYEQTKAIAGQLQSFELNYDNMLSLNAESKRATQNLEKKIGLNLSTRLESGLILQKREELANRTATLTTQSIFVNDSTFNVMDMESFDRNLVKGRGELKAILDTMDMRRYTTEGVSIDNVLNQWLENVVKYDASNASLAVLDKRRQEIYAQFDFYAPIGATVKRKEREININEQEYLSLLNSLSISKLRQQNIAMSSSSLRVVDNPIFPISANSSKSKLYAIITFMAVFLLILAIVLIIEFSDKTLRNEDITRRVTGLDVLGMLPIFNRNSPLVEKFSIEQLISQLMQIRGRTSLPFVINVLSMESKEGKTFLTKIMEDSFTTMGYNVLRLNYETDFNVTSKRYIEALYPSDLTESLPEKPIDIYITELPAAVLNVLPNELIKSATVNLVVIRTNRAWHVADVRKTEQVCKISEKPLFVILNGVSDENIENFTGELPKHRSAFRRFVKKLALRELLSSDKLK